MWASCISRAAVTGNSLSGPASHPRHPGSTAEAHPDDLAVCRACTEPPSPAWPWECCQVPTCPPPPGSSVTTQRWSRSQAGPLAPQGHGRLQEHQPKLKCLFLLSYWLCSGPASTHPSAHLRRARCTRRGPETPRGRERRGAAGTQCVQTQRSNVHVPTAGGAHPTGALSVSCCPPSLRKMGSDFVVLCW